MEDLMKLAGSTETVKALVMLVGLATCASFFSVSKTVLDSAVKMFFTKRDRGDGETYRRRNDEDLKAIRQSIEAISSATINIAKVLEEQVRLERNHIDDTRRDSILLEQVHKKVID